MLNQKNPATTSSITAMEGFSAKQDAPERASALRYYSPCGRAVRTTLRRHPALPPPIRMVEVAPETTGAARPLAQAPGAQPGEAEQALEPEREAGPGQGLTLPAFQR